MRWGRWWNERKSKKGNRRGATLVFIMLQLSVSWEVRISLSYSGCLLDWLTMTNANLITRVIYVRHISARALMKLYVFFPCFFRSNIHCFPCHKTVSGLGTKEHLVRFRKTSCCGLKCLIWFQQTWLEVSRGLFWNIWFRFHKHGWKLSPAFLENIQRCHIYKCWNADLISGHQLGSFGAWNSSIPSTPRQAFCGNAKRICSLWHIPVLMYVVWRNILT